MRQSGEPVDELVGQVEELVLVGSAGEGGAQNGVDLNRGQHGSNAMELLFEFCVLAGILTEIEEENFNCKT